MGEERTLRTFGQLVQYLEDGQLASDLGDKLAELSGKLARVAEAQGKAKGELALKLKFQADAGGTVQLDAEIVLKEPKPARQRTVAWLNKDSTLAAENPKQVKLALREVPAPKRAAKEAVPHDPVTGEVQQ